MMTLSLPKPQRLIMSAVLIALSGCSAIPKSSDQAATKQIDSTMREAVQPAPAPAAPPADVSAALIPKMDSALPSGTDQAALEPHFDIDVVSAPAREFFMSLVQGTPYNMVVHPSVSGSITLTMKNVTVDQVMKTVHRVYGYEYTRTDNGYEVLPNGLQTRVFPVDYLNVQRTGKTQTSISGGGQVAASGGSGGEALGGSQVSTNSKTDFWQELSQTLISVACNGSCSDGQSVTVSPQSGVVIVRAKPAELRAVAQYLKTIQGNLDRQVVLEAKIIEVELSDRFQSGINWALLAQQSSMNRSALFGQTGGGTLVNGNSNILNSSSETASNTGILDPRTVSQVVGTATSAFGGAFSLALSTSDFTAFIELLKGQGKVHVLSSPRVSTVNNQQAVIKVGNDEYFVTDVTNTTTTSAGATTQAPDITLTPFFSGIALDVTPQISKEGFVTLHVHPSVIEVTDQSKTITVGGTTQTLPLAYSTVRESDTIIRAKSGQVVVIGGLMQDRNDDKRAGVPLLGDLPVLGTLFRHRAQTVKKSELIILLRPVVIGGQDDWNHEIRRSSAQINSINKLIEERKRRNR